MFTSRMVRLGAAKGVCRYSTSILRSARVERAEGVLEEYHKPLHILAYGGSRVLEFSRVDTGNILTEGIIGSLQYRFDIMRDIPTIEAVIVSSAHPDLFSNGLELKHLDDKAQRKEYVSKAHQASLTFGALNKETMALYSGVVEGNTFGLFATAKYKLGTDNTCVKISDLHEGRLPLGGGVAHHFAHCMDKGYALARYLGVSGRPLSSQDLYEIGLVSHIVNSNSFADSFCCGLAGSQPDSDKIKAVQSTQVHKPAIREVLDSMHIYMNRNDFWGASHTDEEGQPFGFAELPPSKEPVPHLPVRARALRDLNKKSRAARHNKVDVVLNTKMKKALKKELELYEFKKAEKAQWKEVRESNFEEGHISLLGHPIWNRVSLVTPRNCDYDMHFHGEGNREWAEDLSDVLDEVIECFSADTVAECRQRVEAVAASGRPGVQVGDWVQENWAVRTLAQWEAIPNQALVEEWFSMTKRAGNATLEEYQALEIAQVAAAN